jgi:hypothetical protein
MKSMLPGFWTYFVLVLCMIRLIAAPSSVERIEATLP